MMKLVSIVVPVYNVRDYVLRCLESLTGQSYKNIEIIVVDDGSVDESGEVCDEFAKKDKRVKVFHKKNGGLSSARNYGIKKATGEYICLVDSDDYVKKDFVKELLEAAIQNDADVAVCGYNADMPEARVLSGEEATLRLLIRQENMDVIAWNKLYKRELFNDIKYPDGLNYEDTLTTYKLLSEARRVVYVAKALYLYETRHDSITKSDKKEEKLKFREKAAKDAIGYFGKQKDLCEAAKISLLTAKFAWIDFAINGDVDSRYIKNSIMWIKANKKELLENKYLTRKLRLYIFLITKMSGRPYIIFRKIRHE